MSERAIIIESLGRPSVFHFGFTHIFDPLICRDGYYLCGRRFARSNQQVGHIDNWEKIDPRDRCERCTKRWAEVLKK